MMMVTICQAKETEIHALTEKHYPPSAAVGVEQCLKK